MKRSLLLKSTAVCGLPFNALPGYVWSIQAYTVLCIEPGTHACARTGLLAFTLNSLLLPGSVLNLVAETLYALISFQSMVSCAKGEHDSHNSSDKTPSTMSKPDCKHV